MKKIKSIEDEINQFIKDWDHRVLTQFFEDIYPLIHLYKVEENNDWVKDAVGEEETQTIRIIRTVYLLSKIADYHSTRLCKSKVAFKDLWRRMEQQ